MKNKFLVQKELELFALNKNPSLNFQLQDLNHEEANFKKAKNKIPSSCDHSACGLDFKTQKLKIIHHNTNDPECQDEKLQIVKFIKKFKEFFRNFFHTYEVKNQQYEDWDEYKKLKEQFQKFNSAFIDREKLIGLFGDAKDDLFQN